MAQKEHIRETLSGLPTLEHLVERVEAGWKLVAIEWERQASAAPIEIREKHVLEEIPYGLRVSDDCTGLTESLSERQIIITALDMIVEDCPLSQGGRRAEPPWPHNPRRQAVDAIGAIHAVAAHDSSGAARVYE